MESQTPKSVRLQNPFLARVLTALGIRGMVREAVRSEIAALIGEVGSIDPDLIYPAENARALLDQLREVP